MSDMQVERDKENLAESLGKALFEVVPEGFTLHFGVSSSIYLMKGSYTIAIWEVVEYSWVKNLKVLNLDYLDVICKISNILKPNFAFILNLGLIKRK